ncbi:4-hydroxy-2-oxo-heptane-1,7-dioate aldolase [Paracoccus haematequi]|uniref:Hydroxypyruvate/pyruvate aldolase n=1 Tax=Paracoccus haematequi TaxID=2491866 RepID=A0A3S4GQX8_9RHOB|nr:HpcH/HpaI aldolase/citrate lyase family protein [Paracoccus haematequi]VDS10644.1 4-hydroxy-2-oxo-heptane-1,7-dioate aldolase [Paracoccus haematequi]
MQISINHFKHRLLAGEQLIGIWMSSVSPLLAEMLSLVGYDWMLFDSEHAPVEVSGIMPLLQAAAAGKTSSVVRPAWNDKVLIKRHLDQGAQTLLIPFVESADEAQAAVRAMRYPPAGIRGVAGSTRASRFGLAADYLHRAEEELCLLVQIETGTAMEQLEEIAAVSGVDGVFIGPSDLAASLGHLGNPAHPDVQEVLQNAVARLKATGKPAGILATNQADAQRYLDWGYGFVAASVDTGLLMNAAKGLLANLQKGGA